MYRANTVSLCIGNVLVAYYVTIVVAASLGLAVNILKRLALNYYNFRTVNTCSTTLVDGLLITGNIRVSSAIHFLLIAFINNIITYIFNILINVPTLHLRNSCLTVVALNFNRVVHIVVRGLGITNNGKLTSNRRKRTLVNVSHLTGLCIIFYVAIIAIILLFVFTHSHCNHTIGTVHSSRVTTNTSNVGVACVGILIFTVSTFFTNVTNNVFTRCVNTLAPDVTN